VDGQIIFGAAAEELGRANRVVPGMCHGF
jgi:hypothetical protein